MYYVNIFFIYSFLGFLFENILNVFMNSNFNSGVLYGPWTFIYGIAMLAILFVNRLLQKGKLKKWLEIIIFYFLAVILMTIIEFSGGMLIEKLFHRVYWNYSNMLFNFGNYICLEVSLLWGLFATFINYVVRPHLEKLARKTPIYISVILVVLFVVDIIATVIN